MSIEVLQTHTSTGAKTAIPVPATKNISVATVGDNASYTAAVEVKLTDNGSWFVAQAAITDLTQVNITGPIQDIRLNISALGTATTIDFEVLGQRQ